ncbi:hypothetical protein D3C85_1469200 [compost metagenome]
MNFRTWRQASAGKSPLGVGALDSAQDDVIAVNPALGNLVLPCTVEHLAGLNIQRFDVPDQDRAVETFLVGGLVVNNPAQLGDR